MTLQITTTTGAEMLRSVTPIYNNDDLALAIFEANGKVMHEVGVIIESLKTEMFPQNASWTLDMWEQMLGINTNKNLPDSARVQKVLFELNKYFTVTRRRMEILVNTFIDEKNAVVEDIEGEYAFRIVIPYNNKVSNGLMEMVEEIKPAHLDFFLLTVIDFAMNLKTALLTGEEVTIYPWNVTSIELKTTVSLGSYIQSFETFTVYPQ